MADQHKPSAELAKILMRGFLDRYPNQISGVDLAEFLNDQDNFLVREHAVVYEGLIRPMLTAFELQAERDAQECLQQMPQLVQQAAELPHGEIRSFLAGVVSLSSLAMHKLVMLVANGVDAIQSMPAGQQMEEMEGNVPLVMPKSAIAA